MENSKENVYDTVYCSKFANLQWQDSNCMIHGLHHRFFSKYFPKTSCLKKSILTKSLYQRFNKVAALQCTNCNFTRMVLTTDLREEEQKSHLQENLDGSFLCYSCRSRFYFWNFIKNRLHRTCFPTCILKVMYLWKLSLRYPLHSFSNKVTGSHSTLQLRKNKNNC